MNRCEIHTLFSANSYTNINFIMKFKISSRIFRTTGSLKCWTHGHTQLPCKESHLGINRVPIHVSSLKKPLFVFGVSSSCVHQAKIVEYDCFPRKHLELNRKASIPCELGQLTICTDKSLRVLSRCAMPKVSTHFVKQNGFKSSIVIQPADQETRIRFKLLEWLWIFRT